MIATAGRPAPHERTATHKVAVVNGGRDTLEWLESALAPGHYQILFIDEVGSAYSRIRDEAPELVVLCARIEDLDAFRLLTMLKLDEETRQIPIHTYTTEWEGQRFETRLAGFADGDPETSAPRALPLN